MSELITRWFLCSNDDKTEIVTGTIRDNQIQTLSFGGQWTMRSIGYDSKEALIKGEGVLDEPCRMCGKIVNTKWQSDTKKRLTEKNYCFSCDFWDELSKRTDRIIFNHVCYADSGRKPQTYGILGFGGAEWQIDMHDGRHIETNNLWHNGEIPKHFWNVMPDNAVIRQPITRVSAQSGKRHTLWLPMISPEQHNRLEAGEHIQAVLTNYSADEREFLLTGIISSEWDELFKEEDE